MINIAETDVSPLRHLTPFYSCTKPDFILRLAQSGDLSELALLRLEQLGTNRVGLGEGESSFCASFETFLQSRIATGEWLVLVAETHLGGIAGCVFLQKIAKLPMPGAPARQYGSIVSLFVRKAFRGRSLRGRLLREMMKIARSAGLDFLVSHPAGGARSIFRFLGFRHTDAEMKLSLS